MKQLFKIATLVTLTVLASCTKNDDTSKESIESLSPVLFATTPDVVLKKETSKKAYPNPGKNGLAEFQEITTTQKSEVLQPISPAFDTKTELLFPGSILRGSSFLNSNYDPLVLSNAFEKVTLSTTLKGAKSVAGDYYPTTSGIRTGINELVALQFKEINGAFIPAIIEYTSKDVTTSESLVKSMNIHANIDAKFALSVSAKFGYEKKETNTVDTHYVLISFRQKLYSASIDPKYYKDWIKGGINTAECGNYEPLYISNVDYGRTAYVLFETNLSTQQLYSKVTASLTASYGVVSGGADTEFTSDAKKTFSENKFKAYIFGGPLNGGIVTDLQGLSDFLKKPAPLELVASSVPISYTVRRLKDNTEVAVRTVYTEETAAFIK
jgi:thiol-activated cytolysin